jgi:hypothetical protein
MGDWIKKLSVIQKLTIITAATILALGTILGSFGSMRARAQEVICAAVRPQMIEIADSVYDVKHATHVKLTDSISKKQIKSDSLVVGMWYLLQEMAKPDQKVAAINKQHEVENYPKR